MDDSRVGSALRAVRIRRGWKQADLARRCGVSDSTVSNIERGRIGAMSLEKLRAIAGALDVRIVVDARWRGGELDRLLNARHASLATKVVQLLQSTGWTVAPEVSFAIYGERGWIDILAWHGSTRTLLVVEVKTQLVDVHDTLGVLDRKHRLAPRIARDRGWLAVNLATWLVLEETRTNQRRVEAVGALMRAALPAGTRAMRAWLRQPSGPIAALTFLPNSTGRGLVRQLRVRSAQHDTRKGRVERETEQKSDTDRRENVAELLNSNRSGVRRGRGADGS